MGRGGRRRTAAVLVAGAALAGCSGGAGTAAGGPTAQGSTAQGSTGGSAAAASTAGSPSRTAPETASGTRPDTPAGAPARPLAGVIVVVDPGHDGGNAGAPGIVNGLVDAGTGRKPCDTVGAQTASGYAEHAFTWDLAARLATRLRTAGARVVLTRLGDAGVGPCITERAAIGNRTATAAGRGTTVVGISVHADGGPATGVGFHVIEPLPAAGNDAIVAPSRRLGAAVRDAFRSGTGEPYATYAGTDGIARRGDLGGLNLSRIPKVFVECANMRNTADAARLADPAWRDRAAAALARGLQEYATTG